MRTYPALLAVFPVLACLWAAPTAAAQQAPLRIEVTNVKKGAGKLVVALYQDKSGWLQKPFRKVTLASDAEVKTASFTVPYGNYAVSVYQDTNENGELDQNFLGIPKEPIGFGNNYKPLGKPSFEAAVVRYSATSKPEPIKLFSVL